MHRQPMVSVLIPTYNQDRYIAQAIKSALNQNITFDIEILVGDDGSQDRTFEIVKDIQHQFPEIIKVFCAPTNQGFMRNIYKLLTKANGKYLAFLDGDDYFSSLDKLRKQVDFLETYPEYGVVHSDCDFLYEEKGGGERIVKCAQNRTKHKIPEGNVFEDLLIKNFIISSTACFRSDLCHKYVNFNEFLKQGFMTEDFPIWLELAQRTKFGYIPESLSVYRVLKVSVSRPRGYDKEYRFWNNYFCIAISFIKKYKCSAKIEEILMNKVNKYRLRFAFILRDKLLAKETYSYLRKSKHWPLANNANLYHFGAQNMFTWIAVKCYAKLFRINL